MRYAYSSLSGMRCVSGRKCWTPIPKSDLIVETALF